MATVTFQFSRVSGLLFSNSSSGAFIKFAHQIAYDTTDCFTDFLATGVPEERIKRMGAEDNFWASGATGPCGPCSELYYDLHPERGLHVSIDLDDDSRFIEFYNLVFMELNRDVSGALAPLANKNIDTGMGLERMAQILQGVPNNYETDLIQPIMDVAAGLAGAALCTVLLVQFMFCFVFGVSLGCLVQSQQLDLAIQNSAAEVL